MLPVFLFFSCKEKKTRQTVFSNTSFPIDSLTAYVKNNFKTLVDTSFMPNDSGMVAMAVFLMNDDSVLVDKAYFFSNYSNPLPNDSTIFQMGSVTKTFTAALIARQVNLGKMTLNELAQTYLPQGNGKGSVPELPVFPNSAGDTVGITLGNLATMNSGLDRDAPIDKKNKSTPYLNSFSYLDTAHLLYQPGDNCYFYSNLGFGILGLIASKMVYPDSANYYDKFEQVVVDSLLNSLRMNDTRINLNQGQQKRLAIPYPKGIGYGNPGWPMNYAAGALYSTLSDMKLYAKEMIGLGSYISIKDLDTLLSPRSFVDYNMIKYKCWDINNTPAEKQAMAWVVSINKDKKLIDTIYSKDGKTGGFSTFITFSKPIVNGVQYKAYVVLWANSNKFSNPGKSNIGMLADSVLQKIYNLAVVSKK